MVYVSWNPLSMLPASFVASPANVNSNESDRKWIRNGVWVPEKKIKARNYKKNFHTKNSQLIFLLKQKQSIVSKEMKSIIFSMLYLLAQHALSTNIQHDSHEMVTYFFTEWPFFPYILWWHISESFLTAYCRLRRPSLDQRLPSAEVRADHCHVGLEYKESRIPWI